MRICLLTNDHEFLTHAPIVLEIKGLRRVHAELDPAMAKPDPPNLILAQLASPKFLDYLERREHDPRLSRVPLVVFTDRCAPPDRDEIGDLGAAAIIETDVASQAEITGELTLILRSGATARPLPLEPFAHQRMNLQTFGLAARLVRLPDLDSYCRPPASAIPTPIVALTASAPPRLLGTFETEADAARQSPELLIDLTARPKTSLIHFPEHTRRRHRSDLASYLASTPAPSNAT
ncbi:MAG: hypothetical protein JHD02_00295 [Thermoleophilaceae bacterium]|nr:hypothetical protein [Thermoleophilaceae bacterium]